MEGKHHLKVIILVSVAAFLICFFNLIHSLLHSQFEVEALWNHFHLLEQMSWIKFIVFAK